MQVTAKDTLELELALIGDVTRYHPATYDDPAEGGEVEDYDIEDIGILSLVPAHEREKASHPRGVWKTVSILDGIDMKAPEIQKLIANLLALREREITDALSEASADYDGGDYE